MSHRFQLGHMCEHQQFAESLDGNGLGAWKHMNHRFQLRHMCDPRQVAESLDCNGWAHGVT